jgi:hypothetical protein
MSGWAGAPFLSLNYCGSTWIAGGYSGGYSISTDNGATWSAKATMSTTQNLNQIAGNGKVFSIRGTEDNVNMQVEGDTVRNYYDSLSTERQVGNLSGAGCNGSTWIIAADKNIYRGTL